jgi:octaprenyl-diphosphate synthase
MNSLQGLKTKFTIRFNGNNKDKVGRIIRVVEEYGGIEYSEEMMNNYIKDALGILFTYPDNDYRNSMEKLVRYTVERKR